MGKILIEPQHPVVDSAPSFSRTVGNFGLKDLTTAATVAAISVPFGVIAGWRKSPAFSRVSGNLASPTLKVALAIGSAAGFLVAYQDSSARLMGFSPNEAEVRAARL